MRFSFLQISRMTSIQLVLPVPKSWKYPTELDTTSPEENKSILDAGFNVLKCSKNESAGLNNAYEKARMESEYSLKLKKQDQENMKIVNEIQAKLIQTEKTNQIERERLEKILQERESALQKQIDQANARADVAMEAKYHSEQIAKSIRQSELVHIEEAIQKARNAVANELEQAQKDRETLRNELTNLQVFNTQEKAKLQKQYMDDMIAKMDAMRKECEKEKKLMKQEAEKNWEELKVERDRLHSLQVRQAGSATKGQDNERDFESLLKYTFGNAADFKLFPKKYNSGDFNFLWESYKIMIEVKKGYSNKNKLRDKDGLPKSKDDFLRNSEYDILLFISEDGEIPDHEKPGDIDFGIVDGRPIIYLGNFAKHENKSYFLQCLILPLMRCLIQVYSRKDQSNEEKNETLQCKLNTIQILALRYQSRLKDINKEMLAVKRNIDTGFDRLKAQYNSIYSDFDYMLKIVSGNERVEIEDEVENDVEIQKETRKRKISTGDESNVEKDVESPVENKKRKIREETGHKGHKLGRGKWTKEEEERLLEALEKHGKSSNYNAIAEYIGTRNSEQVYDKLRSIR